MIDFRSSFRIRVEKYMGHEFRYEVDIKKWYWPFWNEICASDYFVTKEFSKYEFRWNSFKSEEEAKAFALDFATRGRVALIENTILDSTIYLGRLP